MATCFPPASAPAIENRVPSKALALLHVPTGAHRDVGEPLEVVGAGGDDDLDVLGAPHDSPGVQREPTHHDELDIRLAEAAQQLVEGRLARAEGGAGESHQLVAECDALREVDADRSPRVFAEPAGAHRPRACRAVGDPLSVSVPVIAALRKA